MKHFAGTKKRGISLVVINTIMTLVAFLLGGALIAVSIVAQNNYRNSESITEGYVMCNQYLHSFDEASDDLTSAARRFAVNGDVVDAQEYHTILLETQDREQSVDNISNYLGRSEEEKVIIKHVVDALNYSNDLADIELYAMKLAALSYEVSELPDEIANKQITAEDAATYTTPEAKRERAITLLFDDNYNNLKANIDNNINDAFTKLTDLTNAKRSSASTSFSGVMIAGIIIVGVLVIFLGVNAFMTFFFLISPLQKIEGSINGNQPVPEVGSTELRYICEVYNQMQENRVKQENILKYEVGHDILTGLYNRHDYTAKCAEYATDSIYFIIADIDRFKGINDTFGHAKGDSVLSELARRLREIFLNHDMVFRIGGAEFVIFIVDPEATDANTIAEKLKGINEALSELEKNKEFPKVSLSFGLTFKSNDVTFEQAYRLADRALYKVKGKGGNDVAIAENKK